MIEVRNVSKVFGVKPERALALRAEGASKEQILAATGCVIGVDDLSLTVEAGEIGRASCRERVLTGV